MIALATPALIGLGVLAVVLAVVVVICSDPLFSAERRLARDRAETEALRLRRTPYDPSLCGWPADGHAPSGGWNAPTDWVECPRPSTGWNATNAGVVAYWLPVCDEHAAHARRVGWTMHPPPEVEAEIREWM